MPNYGISLVSPGQTINNSVSISSYLISRDRFQIFTFQTISDFLEFKNDKILTINCGSLKPRWPRVRASHTTELYFKLFML